MEGEDGSLEEEGPETYAIVVSVEDVSMVQFIRGEESNEE